jgi:hypothetical protein
MIKTIFRFFQKQVKRTVWICLNFVRTERDFLSALCKSQGVVSKVLMIHRDFLYSNID